MFNSRARYLNNVFSLIKKSLLLIVFFVISILTTLNIFGIIQIIPTSLYKDFQNPYMKFFTNTLFFGIISFGIELPFFILGIILNNKLIKIFNNECLEIIHNTKLPDNLPKVLYIYTTHNDFIGARVLQNMRQSYKNFEVWVSDGSDSLEWRNKIKKFCEKNNINLFQLGEGGSKNKADNLNQFLRNYKNNFEYLLVGDADEVFHHNFVESAIKLFYSDKIKNLGFVAPFNVNYRSKGIYANTSRFTDTNSFYARLANNFKLSILPPLSGQSCLISKKSLVECNKSLKFDDGNLEDWYLEASMVETLNFGIMLPCYPCYYEPDANVKANFNRIMRIEDWRTRWWKKRVKSIIKNHNERFSEWYKKYLFMLCLPLVIFAGLGLFSFLIWIMVNWHDYVLKNILFWIAISLGLIYLIFFLIMNAYYTRKWSFKFLDVLLYTPIIIMWVFVANIKFTTHWFKSLFLGKYSEFGGSGNSRFLRIKSKNLKWWISLILLTILISLFNSLMFTLVTWENLKWLIIIFNVYVGVIWLGCFSYLVLWYINFIPYNKNFSRDDWIDCKELI